MIDILKTKKNYDEENANNMASAIFNLAIQLGEAIGPTLGGYITNKRNFATSCVFVSISNLGFCFLFAGYNYKSIIEYTQPNTDIMSTTDDINRDYTRSGKCSRSQSINIQYIGRVRSYSRGNSMNSNLMK
jgi:hypothetical protein